MDQRPDTLSSGRYSEQWAFLSNPPLAPSAAAGAPAGTGTGTGTGPSHGHGHGHWHRGQAQSLPASSYIRSDRSSSVSHLPITGFGLGLASFHDRNASRSSLPRNIHPASVGAHSTATLPTQPVLICINSADASRHLHPAPRPPTQRPIMNGKGELPPVQEYSFDSILATISEDVGDDLTAIGEILGRSRLVLADQHDSHLPPTGEIRASPLQAVAEASASNERLAADQVIIANDEASLIDGSHSGSAAYGLLERLQALHRTPTTATPTSHMTRELPTSAIRLPRGNSAAATASSSLAATAFPTDGYPISILTEQDTAAGAATAAAATPLPLLLPPQASPTTTTTTISSPLHPRRPLFHNLLSSRSSSTSPLTSTTAATTTTTTLQSAEPDTEDHPSSRSHSHLHSRPRTTQPVVSEIYLSAGAGGRIFSDPPVVSESGRYYPLYSYDESDIFEGTTTNTTTNNHHSRPQPQQPLAFFLTNWNWWRGRRGGGRGGGGVEPDIVSEAAGGATGGSVATATATATATAGGGGGSNAESQLRLILGRQGQGDVLVSSVAVQGSAASGGGGFEQHGDEADDQNEEEEVEGEHDSLPD